MIEIVIAVGTVVLAGIGWLIRRALAKLDRVIEDVTAVKIDVAHVKSQVLNNGGTSLRDAVDRTEDRLTEHLIDAATDREQLRAHLAQHAMAPATQVVVQQPPAA